MVQLEETGTIITVIMLAAGILLTAIATQPSMAGSELTKDASLAEINIETINGLSEQFNSDLNIMSSSTGLTQIALGAGTIVTGGRLILSYIVSAFTNWTMLFDMMFGWADGTPLAAFGLVFELIIGFIMVYTIFKFLGGVVKSLPFFGGG